MLINQNTFKSHFLMFFYFLGKSKKYFYIIYFKWPLILKSESVWTSCSGSAYEMLSQFGSDFALNSLLTWRPAGQEEEVGEGKHMVRSQ